MSKFNEFVVKLVVEESGVGTVNKQVKITADSYQHARQQAVKKVLQHCEYSVVNAAAKKMNKPIIWKQK